MADSERDLTPYTTDIPARLDRLPWSRFHWLVVLALGASWAIDELIPARVRGRVSLAINGSFWLGAVAGSAATVVLLDPAILAVDLGWRIGFAIGATLGVAVLFARRFIPESPRWLAIHGFR